MANDQRETVFLSQIPLIAQRKAAGGAVVGVILRDHRVQVMARHIARSAHAERVPFPCVLILSINSSRAISAAEESELSVKPCICALERVDFNNAAQLSAKFRGNASGINFERFGVVGFDLRAEAWRTVVGDGNSVDDKLSLIFRSARMQHRIAFVKPAWF